MIRLDLGAGPLSPADFTPLGNINGTAIYPLPHADNSVEEIRASHVLEHFAHGAVRAVVADWVRALAPGGVLRIAVPDFGKIAEKYVAGEEQNTLGFVMGGQLDAADFHKVIFDRESLRALLADAGLVLLREWQSELADDCAAMEISLNWAGTKPAAAAPRIRAVMTTPRLGFNDMWNSTVSALPRFGIDLTNVTGAFWDQSLTLALDRTLADGACDYVLTLDYDSVFSAGHVARLIELARVYPEADAIAALQASRHGGNPLFGLSPQTAAESDDGKVAHVDRAVFAADLVPVRHAHFGLTLIKASALRSMSRPWFLGVPNVAGEWSEGKTDPDIYFWRRWEDAGRSLFVAPNISIGHLELMVRWMDEDMQPTWQPAKDWEQTKRAPVDAWKGA